MDTAAVEAGTYQYVAPPSLAFDWYPLWGTIVGQIRWGFYIATLGLLITLFSTRLVAFRRRLWYYRNLEKREGDKEEALPTYAEVLFGGLHESVTIMTVFMTGIALYCMGNSVFHLSFLPLIVAAAILVLAACVQDVVINTSAKDAATILKLATGRLVVTDANLLHVVTDGVGSAVLQGMVALVGASGGLLGLTFGLYGGVAGAVVFGLAAWGVLEKKTSVRGCVTPLLLTLAAMAGGDPVGLSIGALLVVSWYQKAINFDEKFGIGPPAPRLEPVELIEGG